jgi:hypothetical protein
MRIWSPVFTKVRSGYNLYEDRFTTEEYTFSISLAFEKILSGFQIRFNYGWTPVSRPDLLPKSPLSRTVEKLVELRKSFFRYDAIYVEVKDT